MRLLLMCICFDDRSLELENDLFDRLFLNSSFFPSLIDAAQHVDTLAWVLFD